MADDNRTSIIETLRAPLLFEILCCLPKLVFPFETCSKKMKHRLITNIDYLYTLIEDVFGMHVRQVSYEACRCVIQHLSQNIIAVFIAQHTDHKAAIVLYDADADKITYNFNCFDSHYCRKSAAWVPFRCGFLHTGGFDRRNQAGALQTDQVQYFNLLTYKFEPMTPMNVPRICHGIISHNQKVYVLGGYDASRAWNVSCEVFEDIFESSELWRMLDAMPQNLPYIVVSQYKDCLYCSGTKVRTLYTFDLNSEFWDFVDFRSRSQILQFSHNCIKGKFLYTTGFTPEAISNKLPRCKVNLETLEIETIPYTEWYGSWSPQPAIQRSDGAVVKFVTRQTGKPMFLVSNDPENLRSFRTEIDILNSNYFTKYGTEVDLQRLRKLEGINKELETARQAYTGVIRSAPDDQPKKRGCKCALF